LYIGGQWAVGRAKGIQWQTLAPSTAHSPPIHIRMYPNHLVILVYLTAKMGPTMSSETLSVNSLRTSCKNPESRKQNLFHGENLKSRILLFWREAM
jgi:hypothetical protein